jgi:hypothetical protein
MSQKLLALFSMGAIALSTLPAAFSQSAANAAQDGVLKMVMVDQSQLSGSQREAFQRYLQTADLPRTQVGKRCQYYAKPQVWCLLLNPNLAEQVYQKLRGQAAFGAAADIKEVRRIREAGAARSGI